MTDVQTREESMRYVSQTVLLIIESIDYLMAELTALGLDTDPIAVEQVKNCFRYLNSLARGEDAQFPILMGGEDATIN